MSSINFADTSFSTLYNDLKLSKPFKRKFSKNFSKKRPLYAKVVIVGNSGVGKTTISMLLDHQPLTSELLSTMGSSFITSKTSHPNGEVCLQIWDTAGQERFRSLVPLYLRNSLAVIIVFDVTNYESYNGVKFWTKEIKRLLENNTLLYLFGNKIDLERCISYDEAKNFATNYNLKYFETSVYKKNTVENAMYKIAQQILNEAESEIKLINEMCTPENDKTIHLKNNKQMENYLSSINEKKEEKRQICCIIL